MQGLNTKWLAVLLALALAGAGWFGWEQYRWREAYYAETVGQMIYALQMAQRQLGRAQESQDYGQKVEAMANAHGYLVTAHRQSYSVLERLAPTKVGRESYMPSRHIPMMLQYARALTPELPPEAVQRRIDLVDGLVAAFELGLTARRVAVDFYAVDTAKLKRSLDEYFRHMPDRGEFEIIQFEDEPNTPTLAAHREGDRIILHIDWSYRYQLFPFDTPSQMLLVGASDGVQVSSNAGEQQRLITGAFAPFRVLDNNERLHEYLKPHRPEEWSMNSYTVIFLPQGLQQTLTLRVPAGSEPALILVGLQNSGTKAVRIPIE